MLFSKPKFPTDYFGLHKEEKQVVQKDKNGKENKALAGISYICNRSSTLPK